MKRFNSRRAHSVYAVMETLLKSISTKLTPRYEAGYFISSHFVFFFLSRWKLQTLRLLIPAPTLKTRSLPHSHTARLLGLTQDNTVLPVNLCISVKAEGDRGHIRTRISGYVSTFPEMPQGLELVYKILQIPKF